MTTSDQTTAGLADAYPLACLQSGMLFRSEYENRSAVYHDVLTLVLRGVFDRQEFGAAVAELVSRHPVLRTSFAVDGFSEPLQLVHTSVPDPLTVIDWAHLAPETADEQLAHWREAEKYVSFDTAVAPLLRVVVHVLAGDRFAMSLSFHHAILDGWSLGLVVTELLNRYTARLDGQPAPGLPSAETFADFVALERQACESAEDVRYWSGVVEGAPLAKLPRLPGDSSQGESLTDQVTVELESSLLSGLAEAADRLGTSLRRVLLAAHLRVVGLLSAETDVTTGVLTHGRAESAEGAESVGLFLNTVPLRVRVDAPSWAALVGAVDEAESALMPHRRYPHFEITRLAGRVELFDTLFDFRDPHVYHDLRDNRRLTILDIAAAEHVEIPFNACFIRSPLGKSAGLTLELGYSRREFDRAQVEAIGRHYLTALRALAADPGADPRPTAPFLPERRPARPRDGDASTLPDLLASAVARDADAFAVADGTTQLTYGELADAVRRRAAWLRARGLRRGQLVGVYLPRSVELVATVLAVLHTGAAVLPLELDYPPERIAETMVDAAPDAVLTSADGADRLTFAGEVPVIEIGEIGAVAGDGGDAFGAEAEPEATAYVLTTSGSTGRPKCIELSHAALTHFCTWAAGELGLDPADRMAQRTGIGFDAFVSELHTALAAGCGLVVVPAESNFEGEELAGFLADHGVTAMFMVPSMLGHHFEVGTFRRCPALRVLILGGEAVPQAMVDAFAEQYDARVYVAYGPTETTIMASGNWASPGAPGQIVPIGTAVPGHSLHVVDDHGREQPPTVAGELWVGGPYLATGYLGRPGLTATRFVADHLSGTPGARLYRTGDRVRWLPDGRLEFLGRTDRQRKIRGVRVELDEVEGAVARHPLVRDAAVAVYEPGAGGQALAAYVVWRDGAAATPAELLAELRTRLPSAMVPGVVVTLAELPRLANGKVDRAALPEPEPQAREHIAPRDSVEARLAEIWADILGVETVGIRDDFFELGGHSLRALRLTMRVRSAFDRDLPAGAVIESPTVERLAALLRSPEHLVPAGRVLKLRDGGDTTPLILHHALGGQVFYYQQLARRLSGRTVLGVPAHGFDPGDPSLTSMDEIVSGYVAHIRKTRAHGPYLVGGACVGGNIGLEVGRRLREAGEEVPVVVMFHSHALSPVYQKSIDDDTTLMMYALAGGPVALDPEATARLSPEEKMLAVIKAASAEGSLFPDAADAEQARRMLEVYRANAFAVHAHRHQPYSGDVLLLVPGEQDGLAPDDPMGWDQVVTGKLDVLPIPGDLTTCLREPAVAGAAKILSDFLAEVDTRFAGPGGLR